MKLEFIVRNKRLSCRHAGPLVGDTASHYTVSFDFDEEWDDLVKVISFRNGGASAQLIYTGECDLPPQVSGKGELDVACHGYRSVDGGVEVVRTFRMARPMRLLAAGPLAEEGGENFTPSLFAQVLGAVGDAQAAAGQAEQAVRELEQQKTEGGFNGGYYVPRASMAEKTTLQLDFVGSRMDMEPLQFRIPLPQNQCEDRIPIPETARAGQVLQVADVDENGRPYAWETVDLPSGIQETVLVDLCLEEEVKSYIVTLSGSQLEQMDELHLYIKLKPTTDPTYTNWSSLFCALMSSRGASWLLFLHNLDNNNSVPPCGGKDSPVEVVLRKNPASPDGWWRTMKILKSGAVTVWNNFVTQDRNATEKTDLCIYTSPAAGLGAGTEIKLIGWRYVR